MDRPRFILWRGSDRWHYLTLVVLTAVLAGLITLLNVVFTVTRVEGPSMEPTLRQEDRVLVTHGYDSPARGDIVSFTAVEQDGRSVGVIKRVIAVPGDTVEIVGDTAWVNGVVSDAAPAARIGAESYRLGPFVVPEGTIYVLGDNRPLSLDSRMTGPVALEAVKGKAVAIIFPPARITGIDE